MFAREEHSDFLWKSGNIFSNLVRLDMVTTVVSSSNAFLESQFSGKNLIVTEKSKVEC